MTTIRPSDAWTAAEREARLSRLDTVHFMRPAPPVGDEPPPALPPAPPSTPPPLPPPHRHGPDDQIPWLAICAAVMVGLPAGAFAAFHPDLIMLMFRDNAFQTITIGIVTAAAAYLWSLKVEEPIDTRTIVLRSAAGGVFGLIGANAAAGAFNVNDHLQTAIAGVSGAKGPDLIDRIVNAFLDKGKG